MKAIALAIVREVASIMMLVVIAAFLALVIIMALQKAASPSTIPLRATVQLRAPETGVVELTGDLDSPGQFAEDHQQKAGSK